MANLTAVISADTSKFVSGIKSAQDTLDKFVKETNAASDSTKKNIVATDEQVAAYQRVIKQLDKVGSGTMSTSQQQKALTDQIKELKVQWQNLSDDAKKSEFGKSMADTMKIATDELNKLKTQLASIDDIKPGEKVKTQLRQTTEMLQNLSIQYAQLSAAEKTSPFGVELAKQIDEVRKKAGSLKDVVADVDAEIKVMASDTPHLDAFNQGLGIGADLVSTYTSLIAKLTGDENKLKDAIATIATVQSFANLSTKITNQLQSSSILMMKTRKIQEAAAAAAIRIRTAAETKGTVATKAATVAQAAFNVVAKANPYVLLATALVAAGAAILGFTLKTKDSTKALYDAKEMQKKYNEKMEEAAEEAGNNIAKFKILETQYKSLSTTAEKTKWIQDNTDKFNELGLSINSVNDAEKAFNENSKKIIKAMQLRAEASAMMTLYQEQYAEAYKKSLKIAEGKQASFMSSGTFRNVWNKAGIGEGDYTHSTTMMQSSAGAYSQSIYSLTPSGVAKMQEYWKQQGQNAMDAFEEGAAGIIGDMSKKLAEAATLEAEAGVFGKGGKGGLSGSSSGGDNKELKNRLDILEKEKRELEAELPYIEEYSDRWKEVKLRLAELKDEIKDVKEEEDAWLRRQRNPIGELKPIEVSILPTRVEMPKRLPEIKVPIRPVVKKKTFAEIKAEIDSVLESYNKLADGVSGVVGSINSIYNAFKNLGERMEETENGWEAFVVAFETGMTVLDSVANLISSITTIMELLNTVKQASTLLTQKDTIATVANTGAKVGEASANATEAGTAGAAAAAEAGKSVASVPYAGPALAAAAILMVMGLIAGVIASAKTFATGGIIQGGSNIGDYNIARVNSGEMILNGTQQKRMFNLLDGNTTTGNNTVGTPQVEFKIKGTELIGCINNVSKKRSKI